MAEQQNARRNQTNDVPAFADLGVPATLLIILPRPSLRIFKCEEMVSKLCEFCYSGRNLILDKTSPHKVVGVFCHSCLIRLANCKALACTCGGRRFLNLLGEPKGPLCSTCHQKHS